MDSGSCILCESEGALLLQRQTCQVFKTWQVYACTWYGAGCKKAELSRIKGIKPDFACVFIPCIPVESEVF